MYFCSMPKRLACAPLADPLQLGDIISVLSLLVKGKPIGNCAKLINMYIGVDIGGTKTLLAVIKADGEIKEKIKFPTPQKYEDFLTELASSVDKLSTKEFEWAGVASPGVIDREHGIGRDFGNLAWEDVHIARDIERIIDCPVSVENDAKLAGLSEAKLVSDDYSRVLYVTISTGIGYALIVDGKIDTKIGDGGGKALMVEHNDVVRPWEEFASGKAIVERFGKRASEIDDPNIWKIMARDFALGFIDLIAVLSPEVIIIGGGVGTHFHKYKDFLLAELKRYETPMLPIPRIIEAQRPEEAVIYGCYEMIRNRHG